jgi:hypothetical protein
MDYAARSYHGHVDDEILDVPISVLLHPRRPRRHPSAQRAELDRIGLVAARVALLVQVAFQRLADDASLKIRVKLIFVSRPHLKI